MGKLAVKRYMSLMMLILQFVVSIFTYVGLFDEPLDFCSDDYIDTFLHVLSSECQNHVVLISTGVLPVALRISSDVLILNNGELNEISEEMINIPEINNAILDILGDLEE